jgi:predicted ATPase
VISKIILKLLSKNAEDRYQSGFGIISDLKKILEEFRKTGNFPSLSLASQDSYSYFHISEKLYGREKEINSLLETYERILNGTKEVMLIKGYSGIGKSSLVHEIYKPIAKKGGYFISGKFDQYKHNIPYAAFTQAFEELIKEILTENEQKIEYFRKKILSAIGENGQLIIEVIPILVSLIGKQNPVPKLGPIESQNRFNNVFQEFIGAFTDLEHSLVIFLDDLQ